MRSCWSVEGWKRTETFVGARCHCHSLRTVAVIRAKTSNHGSRLEGAGCDECVSEALTGRGEGSVVLLREPAQPGLGCRDRQWVESVYATVDRHVASNLFV